MAIAPILDYGAAMSAPKPKVPACADDPAEYQRFVEAVRKQGADESPDALDRAFERVMKQKNIRTPSGDAKPSRPCST